MSLFLGSLPKAVLNSAFDGAEVELLLSNLNVAGNIASLPRLPALIVPTVKLPAV